MPKEITSKTVYNLSIESAIIWVIFNISCQMCWFHKRACMPVHAKFDILEHNLSPTFLVTLSKN